MSTLGDPVELLEDQQAKTYFLGVLESNLSSEQKYDEFIRFFRTAGKIRDGLLARADEIMAGREPDITQAISQVSQQMDLWKPQQRLDEVEDSIRRALRRLKKSQHPDNKGWGYGWRQTELWGTGHVVLCLNAARTLDQFRSDEDVERMLGEGLAWIDKYREEWSVGDWPSNNLETYKIALAIRCFCEAGKGRAGAETRAAIERCVVRLTELQNQDGGWNAYVQAPKDMYSEVGATSAALQAFGASGDTRHKSRVARGAVWLLATQNRDGSWNQGSCHYDSAPKYTLDGGPVINKTCDALQGLLVAQHIFGVKSTDYQKAISMAVAWLQSRERPIFEGEDRRKIEGWGWSSHEDTSLTLETLVRMPDASLPLLSSNAQWLIKKQHTEDGSDEDGNWQWGDTARIAHALIYYYKRLKESAISVPAQ